MFVTVRTAIEFETNYLKAKREKEAPPAETRGGWFSSFKAKTSTAAASPKGTPAKTGGNIIF